jgi:hypothetical protein
MSPYAAVCSCLVFVLKIAEMSSLRDGLLKLDWGLSDLLHQNRLCLPKSRLDEIDTFC